MKTVKLKNLCMKKDDAEKEVAQLNAKFGGKTYMKLNFVAWPIGGSFDLGVRGHAESEEELLGMVLNLFTSEILEAA